MKKIKPLSKKHRFRKWIQRLFGIKQPSKVFAEQIGGSIAEMPLMPFPRQILEQAKVFAEVTDYHLDRLPLTEAELRARIHRELAEKLTREIIEKELYTVIKHEDPINFSTTYRARITILIDKKEGET